MNVSTPVQQFYNHDYDEGSLQRSPTQVQFKEETAIEPQNTKNGRVFKLVVNQPKTKEHARLIVPFVDEKPKHTRQKSQDIYNQEWIYLLLNQIILSQKKNSSLMLFLGVLKMLNLLYRMLCKESLW